MNAVSTGTRISRWKAAAFHLGISATAGTLVVSTMLLVWYPGPFFTAMGGADLAMMIIGVDVVLGPLVTLIIFSPAKRVALLRMDLAIIGTLQAAALAYGIYVVAEARPVYMVYTIDRFDVVAANDLRDEELARVSRPEFRGVPWGRPRTVAVVKPTEPDEQLRVMMSALAGADLQTFPQYYVPYEGQAPSALKRSRPLADLRRRHPEHAAHIDEVVEGLGRREADTRYLPLRARSRDYSVLLDAGDGTVVGFVNVNPW